MGRRSERLSRQGMLASDLAGEGDVIQVVSRAFDVLRCFESHEARLGNLEISNRCGLPRSTVSRLTHTLTRMGQLVYLPRDQKYRIGPSAVAMSTSMMRGLQLRNLIRLRLQDVAEQLPGTVGFVIPDRFHLVYLEFARAANALGLHETTGSRIAMASTAAGHAYTAALDDGGRRRLARGNGTRNPRRRQAAAAAPRDQPALSARAWLCRRLRPVEPAYQRPRGAAVVAAIPDLRGGDDRPVVGDVRREAAAQGSRAADAPTGRRGRQPARGRRRRAVQQPAGKQGASGVSS